MESAAFALQEQMSNTAMFSEQSLEALKNVMVETEFKKGMSIYWEGDPSDKLYYVIKGRVKVFKSAYDGKDLVLHYFTPDDLFGELGCFGYDEYSFTANCVTDCTIGVIAEKEVEALLTGNIGLSFEFMKWIGLMNQYTEIKMRDLLFYGKNGALASTLIRMAHGFGKKEADGIHYTIGLTNSDLAQLIGSTRETVNRMLQSWKNDGAIGYYHGSIVIKDVNYIKAICHCEDRCPMNICRL
ncbi:MULTISPECIES: Crp/Fnr family transcriptional regulator [unclassified Sporolactobacillus]|uniref:Crp/Fnr family transcriptional regulator n=1 Tax=unclassified Sporolactobacillus TaxID=2628533 RepID=UPI002368370A|nr:Crp/Fnr family transcriptional regulator [Sporolactobacillus sp. CQH2019]MDD9149376.1 Crp/Fnr family transcriptional regulator [Sporolactobacillus sp. CQH2019]